MTRSRSNGPAIIHGVGSNWVDLLDPDTGELVDLDNATDGLLARALDDVVAYQHEVTSWRRLISDEVIRRMDTARKWTVHADGFKLTAPSPTSVEYDAAALRLDLDGLASAGRFGVDAVDDAVELVVGYRVKAARLKALGKLGPDVQQVIDAHTAVVDKPRTVRVARG